MLSEVFFVALGPANGPEIALFKRFQSKWPHIDKVNFVPTGDEILTGMPDGLRREMTLFYADAMKGQMTRGDYRELLQLCDVFLGGSCDGLPSFRATDAMHNARWMAKAIHSLKIFLFKGQMKLTAREEAGITTVSLFVSLVYARYWHEAPLAERAPFNDFKLLALLHEYAVAAVRKAAIESFSRHLWCFAEHLAPLALFDDRVSEETEAAMVRNFVRPHNPAALKRLDKKDFDYRTPLEAYVTARSLNIFNLLSANGKEEANAFFSKPPAIWPTDPTFQSLKENVTLLKVVNDCAERGIALIQSYNSALTKDEMQKQYLLQLVAMHRKTLPVPTKTAKKSKT